MSEQKKIPAPRLQLTWRESTEDEREKVGYRWACDYSIVIPLKHEDIRAEDPETGELGVNREKVVIINTSFRDSTKAPCDGDPADTPYRDGAHAKWDAEVLGALPVYVVSPDGTFAQVPARGESQ